MKIVKTTNNESIDVIFRENYEVADPLYVMLKSRSTNKTILKINEQAFRNSNYYTWTLTQAIKDEINMVENNYYDIWFYYQNTLYNRETLFCTDQTIDPDDNRQYDPNKDNYVTGFTTNNNPNEYIIL